MHYVAELLSDKIFLMQKFKRRIIFKGKFPELRYNDNKNIDYIIQLSKYKNVLPLVASSLHSERYNPGLSAF